MVLLRIYTIIMTCRITMIHYLIVRVGRAAAAAATISSNIGTSTGAVPGGCDGLPGSLYVLSERLRHIVLGLLRRKN